MGTHAPADMSGSAREKMIVDAIRLRRMDLDALPEMPPRYRRISVLPTTHGRLSCVRPEDMK